MKQKSIGRHKAALAALFAVGNPLLITPWQQLGNAWIWWLPISLLASLLPALLCYPVFCAVFGQRLSRRPARICFAAVLALLLGAAALLTAERTIVRYLEIALPLILPERSAILPAILLLLCAWSLAVLKRRGLDSAALLGFAVALTCVAVLFAFGIPHMTALQIDFAFPKGMNWGTYLPQLLWSFSLPSVVLSAYLALSMPHGGIQTLAAGIVAAFGILVLCLLQTVGILGVASASGLFAPYVQAVRILSVGQYFFRLEGLAYLFDHLSCLLRVSVCLATVRRLWMRFFPMRTRLILPASCALLLLLLWGGA